MFNRILIVCLGNICRSPTAERIMRARLHQKDGVEISSAGLTAVVGHPVDGVAADVLLSHGISPEEHVAHQLTQELALRSDLILTMEKSYLQEIHRLAPAAQGRVFLLGKWLGDVEIPDPYRRSREMYDSVYQQIDRAVSGWIPYI